jgi:hypothetical protein
MQLQKIKFDIFFNFFPCIHMNLTSAILST